MLYLYLCVIFRGIQFQRTIDGRETQSVRIYGKKYFSFLWISVDWCRLIISQRMQLTMDEGGTDNDDKDGCGSYDDNY